MSETWAIVDERTGRQVSVACYGSAVRAQAQIDGWTERDAKGGRQDCHHLIGHMIPKRIDADPE